MRSLHQIALVVAVIAAGCSVRDLAAGGQTTEAAPRAGPESAARKHTNVEPRIEKGLAFDGSWSVSWCDQKRPERECGRFSLQLIQEDDALCGSYFGARPGLSQIDEGGARAIKGQVLGDTAVLTVRSGRSGVIYLVRLRMDSDSMHWKVVDTVLDGSGDVDVIALDTTMKKDMGHDASESYATNKEACVQIQ